MEREAGSPGWGSSVGGLVWGGVIGRRSWKTKVGVGTAEMRRENSESEVRQLSRTDGRERLS